MFFSILDKIIAKVIDSQLEYNRHNIESINNIIAFSSDRSQVGKTTIAVNLAVMLAQTGLKIGLLDAETNSDRTSKILGIKDGYVQGSQDFSQPKDNFGIKLVSIGSLVDEDLLEDSYDHWLNREIKRILEEVQWGNLDYLIVNLPPGMGEIQIALTQALSLDGVVMVTANEKKTHPDIYQILRIYEQLKIPFLGLVENKSDLLAADLSKRKYEIRGSESLNQKIRVPFLGYIPLYPSVSQYSDRGLPIVLAEPSSMFTTALQIIVWAISSQISISALKS